MYDHYFQIVRIGALGRLMGIFLVCGESTDKSQNSSISLLPRVLAFFNGTVLLDVFRSDIF